MTSSSPRSSASRPSKAVVARMTAILVAFFVAGAAMAFFIWSTLSEFLAGKPVEGGAYLIAMALIGVFIGLAWLMSLYIVSVVPPDADADGWDPARFSRRQ